MCESVFFQSWREVQFEEPIEKGYHNWSNGVIAERDIRPCKNYGLGFWNWLGKLLFWDRRVILVPSGLPEVNFYIVFRDSHGRYLASSAKRRIGNGPFMMRTGPSDIKFFIVGKDGGVKLSIAGYVRGSMKLY